MTTAEIYREILRLHHVVCESARERCPIDFERRYDFAARQLYWAWQTLEPLLTPTERKELAMSPPNPPAPVLVPGPVPEAIPEPAEPSPAEEQPAAPPAEEPAKEEPKA